MWKAVFFSHELVSLSEKQKQVEDIFPWKLWNDLYPQNYQNDSVSSAISNNSQEKLELLTYCNDTLKRERENGDNFSKNVSVRKGDLKWSVNLRERFLK